MYAIFLFAALFAVPAFAQTASPILQPHVTFVDSAGSPCTGCKFYSYLAGSSTPTPTYTDASLGPQNTNPITLDAAGGAQIWVSSAIAYKFELHAANGSLLWTVDNVAGSGLCTAGCTLTGPVKIGTSIELTDGSTDASVLAFGALCDGTTDDTTAIQAAITWIGSHHGTLSFPVGTCNISSSLTIPLTQHIRLTGQSRLGSIISMTADNLPIFVASHSLTHSIEIDHLDIGWVNQQTTSDPLSFGIEWTGSAGESFFRWHVHDLEIDRPYIGMGILSSGAQSQTVWNSTFEDVIIAKAAHSGVSLAPAVSAGMPVNVFVNLSVNNTGGGPVPDGPAVYLVAVEATFVGLDIEGWKNEAIWAQGGGFVDVFGCHIEHHTLTSTGRFVYIANGPIMMEGCQFEIDGTPTFAGAQVIGVDSGGFAKLHGSTIAVTPASGAIYWSSSGIANSLDFFHLIDTLSGLTPYLGNVSNSLAAFASWPDVFPFLKQNQTTPQLVQVGSTNPLTAAYMVNLGPDVFTPGTVLYRNASSGNWHTNWFYLGSSQVWHYQTCADVAGAAPPVTIPTGCSDVFAVSNTGALSNANGIVIPAAVTGTHGSTGLKIQMSDNTGTSVLAAFDSNGNLTGAGTNIWYIAATACTPTTSTDAQCSATQSVTQPDAAYGANITMLSSAGANLVATVTGKSTTTLSYVVSCTFNCGSYGTVTADINVHHN